MVPGSIHIGIGLMTSVSYGLSCKIGAGVAAPDGRQIDGDELGPPRVAVDDVIAGQFGLARDTPNPPGCRLRGSGR